MDNLDNNNILYKHQKIIVALKSVTETSGIGDPTGGIDVTLSYFIEDDMKFGESADVTPAPIDVLSSTGSPAGLTAPLGIVVGSGSSSATTYHNLKFHLEMSESFILKFSTIKVVLGCYKQLKDVLSQLTQFNINSTESKTKAGEAFQLTLYQKFKMMYALKVSKLVIEGLLPVISAILTVVYTFLTATTFGATAAKLAGVLYTLVMSSINFYNSTVQVLTLTNIDKPLHEYFGDVPLGTQIDP
jgi:hypothetical protein